VELLEISTQVDSSHDLRRPFPPASDSRIEIGKIILVFHPVALKPKSLQEHKELPFMLD
jgi:hypothetical protein